MTLNKLGTNENVKDILLFLKDKNTCVRYITIEAIGKLGDITALDLILPYIDDLGKKVRDVVIEAIIAILKREKNIFFPMDTTKNERDPETSSG